MSKNKQFIKLKNRYQKTFYKEKIDTKKNISQDLSNLTKKYIWLLLEWPLASLENESYFWK